MLLFKLFFNIYKHDIVGKYICLGEEPHFVICTPAPKSLVVPLPVTRVPAVERPLFDWFVTGLRGYAVNGKKMEKSSVGSWPVREFLLSKVTALINCYDSPYQRPVKSGSHVGSQSPRRGLL